MSKSSPKSRHEKVAVNLLDGENPKLPYDFKMTLPIKQQHKIVRRFIKDVRGVQHTYIAVHMLHVRGAKFVTYRVLDVGVRLNEAMNSPDGLTRRAYELIDAKWFKTEAGVLTDLETRGSKTPHAHPREVRAKFEAKFLHDNDPVAPREGPQRYVAAPVAPVQLLSLADFPDLPAHVDHV